MLSTNGMHFSILQTFSVQKKRGISQQQQELENFKFPFHYYYFYTTISVVFCGSFFLLS